MSKLRIRSNSTLAYTLLSNDFVDRFMVSAHGEFVKLYIYLLRHEQAGSDIPDLSSIADALSCQEKDIVRALTYWEKQGLLALSYDDSALSGITFLSQERSSAQAEAGIQAPADIEKTAVSAQAGANTAFATHGTASEAFSISSAASLQDSEKPSLSPEQICLSNERRRNLLQSNEEAKQICFIAEQYIGKVLTGSDLNRILYFYDELHFSVELIDYLIEYCVSRNKRSIHYIVKVGLGWYEDGITSVTEAKDRTSTWGKDYYAILRAMGISGVNPVPKQVAYMKRWLYDYGFSLEIICEACQRTVAKTGQPSFDYAEGILSSWKNHKVSSMEQIKTLDQKHQEKHQKSSAEASEKSPAQGAQTASKPVNNRFNNFHQREYNYAQLEKDLLQRQLAKNKK